RATVSRVEMRSARATASAFHTVSLSTHQDYRHPNARSSLDQVEHGRRGRGIVAWGIGALAPSGRQQHEAPISYAPAKPYL
ncbi:hypothetical protein, partial [Amycolatopsis sp. NPDC051371]|uniref:hypothetical protein n=1 Tax=Amycolatopsis sp. NPDC051371 TaxID=3155800 RepID=UPI003440785A